MRKLIFLLIALVLTGCSDDKVTSEADVSQLKDVIASLEANVELLNNEVNTLEKLNEEMAQEIKSLNEIQKIADNSKHMEVSNDGIYVLQDFNGKRFIGESIRGTNRGDFYLVGDNIFDFKVSNDNRFIAVIYYDMKNVDEQYLEIYKHEGSLLYRYNLSEFKERASDNAIGENEMLILTGFSGDGTYLWGGFSHGLDMGCFYSVNTSNGEMNVYEYNNIDKYQELQEQYPIER